MNDLPAVVAAIVPALGGVLVDFLWQGALLGLLAWVVLSLLRHAQPQARYAVACVALLACVLVPAWQLVQALAAGAGRLPGPISAGNAMVQAPVARDAGVQALDALAALPALPDDVLPWIVATWAAGAGLFALRMACGLWWVQRLRARSLPDHEGWQPRLDALARRLGLQRAVSLRLVADGDTPLTVGWWKPVVLLPAALALRMPTHLLEALLAHELAHVRRHDYLVNLLQGVVEVVLFYHPVTWWLSRRIRIEREQVADDIAATSLGEPRRLAVALSELDRCTAPYPAFAQAANGGQLMSRIQQLVRPDRRAANGLALLPLLGLAAAGLVFAQVGAQPTAAPSAPVAVATTAAQVAPAPARRVAPATRPIPVTTPAPAARASTQTSVRGRRDGPGYALVRKGREGFSMSGDLDDITEIRDARARIDGDFIWFRRDGQAFVVRDASLLQRAEAAWAPTQALESRMQVLDARMRPHQEKLEALATRMQALHVDDDLQSPGARAAAARMETLGQRMEVLARRQLALALRRDGTTAAGAASPERQREALGAEQEALGREMERHARVLEAASRRMEAQSRPMEALGREMELASQPMQSIGKDMEALGRQMEQKASVADHQIRALIDEAVGRGLATPAPGRG